MKRFFDIVISFLGLAVASPFLFMVLFLVWKQDRQSPLYIARRVGQNEKIFKMVKLRSMVVNADSSGVDSTGTEDKRITSIGHFIRRYKLDEVTQLWNVLLGDMSLVGPRPNVQRETDLYSTEEKKMLSVRPGITDYSSIVFSDEGDILADHDDPDLAYNQLIRPWKSRLGLIYINNQSLWLDIELILYTLVAIVSKQQALDWVVIKLESLGVEHEVVTVCKRDETLMPFAPPGMDEAVTSR